ncbi:MAG TPA: hypothetical protein VKG80_05435 [Trebonia sp.]|nr:hypothetical protein [Trebonia sp.]
MSLELGQTTDRGGQFPMTNETGGPATTDLDGPLVGDMAGLRSSWQRIQAEFVDDPREAVVDAAALVEHVTQTLVGTLRQRQRRLRGMWDGSAAQATFAPDDTGTGTANGGSRPAATFTPKHASTAEADAGAPQATFTPDDTLPPDTTDDVRTADSGRAPAAGEDPRGGDFQDGGFQDAGVRSGAAPAGNGVPPAAPVRAGQPAANVVADTEQLRLVLRRYRSLLDQLCPPA